MLLTPLKQQSCEIFVEKVDVEKEVQRTETMITKRFRCYAPFELVSIDFLQIFRNSVALNKTVGSFDGQR